MEITVNELELCKLDITYKADSEEVSDKLNSVMQTFKNAPVSGFRKGKAPVKVIKQKYKNQINESLKRAMVEDAYHNVLFEKNLTALGNPEISSANLLNNTFECSMVLHVKPTFDIKPYDSYEMPTPHIDTTADDLTEKMLHELRVRYGEVTQYEDDEFVQKGDNVIVNYIGTIDGEVVDSLSAEGEMLTVGVSRLTDFDDNLLGMTLGETRTFELVIPEDGLPSLAGKKVSFETTLVTGSKTIPAALDDELAKKINKETFDDLRIMVAANSAQRVSEMHKSALIESISNRLVSDYDFEVPQWLIQPEARQLAAQSKADWNELADVDKEQFYTMAERNTKLSLILDKIRSEDPDAQLSDEEVYDTIKNTFITFSGGSVTEENVNEQIKSLMASGQYRVLAARQLDEHTLNYVIGLTKMVD